MPIFTFTENTLSAIDQTEFGIEGIFERQNLQEAIKKNISIICDDCECLVISEEFSDWSDGHRRIDLLAIDKNANLVVIELKRDNTGGHMELQALRYAAMVSTMTYKQAVEIYEEFIESNNLHIEAEKELLSFLEWNQPDEENFASDIRVILVSSDFSKELTTSVMWLIDKEIDIRCVRIIPYRLDNELIIDVQQLIPLPEVEDYQVKVRRKKEEIREAKQSNRDRTKYFYQEEIYNKRQLVLAVLLDWFNENQPENIQALRKIFTQKRLFVSYSKAMEIANRGINRHFIEENELLTFPDGSQYAISNQWGIGNIEEFIYISKQLGIVITEI